MGHVHPDATQFLFIANNVHDHLRFEDAGLLHDLHEHSMKLTPCMSTKEDQRRPNFRFVICCMECVESTLRTRILRENMQWFCICRTFALIYGAFLNVSKICVHGLSGKTCSVFAFVGRSRWFVVHVKMCPKFDVAISQKVCKNAGFWKMPCR